MWFYSPQMPAECLAFLLQPERLTQVEMNSFPLLRIYHQNQKLTTNAKNANKCIELLVCMLVKAANENGDVSLTLHWDQNRNVSCCCQRCHETRSKMFTQKESEFNGLHPP